MVEMDRVANPIIRGAIPADCDEILAVHKRAIRELCKGEYSQTQLAAWADRLTPQGYLPAIERNVFLVSEIDARVVGFCEFSVPRGEVVAMYIHPVHARHGIGTLLFNEVERIAQAHAIGTLTLSSSLSAVSFYERLGFIAGARSTHRLGNGTEIPCVAMSRSRA